MEFHLLKIAESSESIRTLYYKPPSIFTNAQILKPEITTLIHDAEDGERALFTTGRQNIERKPKTANTGFINMSELSRRVGEVEEWNVDTMCAVVERLASMQPGGGGASNQQLAAKLETLRDRWTGLNMNIMKYEEIVEEQRQQLDQLKLTIESRDFEDIQQDPQDVRQRIRQVQQEVSELEQELSRRQQEVAQMEGHLMNA